MSKIIDILLVEDNAGDARLASEALKESKVLNNLIHLDNGLDALKFLKMEGDYKNASKPDLILLDLNLPGMDGREVLKEIKSDPNLKRIPVVILTSSRSEEDILKSYDFHANCYISKPIDLEQFVAVVKSIEDFWFTIVKLP